MSIKTVIYLLFLSMGQYAFVQKANAQPSEATIKQDAGGNEPGVNAFYLTEKAPKIIAATKSLPGQWMREVVMVRNSLVKDVRIEIRGYAIYEIDRQNNYRFKEFKQYTTRYSNLPQITYPEVHDLIASDWSGFYGTYYNRIYSVDASPAFTDEPIIRWFTPNSVELHIKAQYTYISTDTQTEKVKQVYVLRMYRDDVNKPWKRFNSNPIASDENEVLFTANYNKLQILQMYKKTLPFQ